MLARIFVFAAVLVSAFARDLDNYSFEEFVKEFNFNYHPSEIATRRELFNSELNRIKVHNAKNLSWKEDVTKFSAMSPQEKKAFFGRNKGVAQNHGKALKNANDALKNLQLKPVDSLPKNIDWRNIYPTVMTAVKDQGHCGSCWAFASTAVVESHVAISSGKLFDLSVQQMAMCAPNPDNCGGSGGCAGATAEIAFDYVTNSNGLFSEFQYSYQSYYGTNYACALPSGKPAATINGFVKLPENNYTALMNAIATVGPIAISVDASTWSSYSSGIFSGCNQDSPDINHAVVLVGYGEENGQKYWLVRNSWSASWGEKGYIRLARADTDEQVCGTDVTPQDGTACEGQTDPVKVCGTCGVLYDSSYPLNAKAN